MKGMIASCVLGLVFLVQNPANAFVFISEVLADPPAGLTGDSNNDGIGHFSQDEFVELYNSSNSAVNISHWQVSDAVKVRHIFPNNTFIGSQEFFVVFGGGVPNLPSIDWQTASTGSLGLNNTGDTVTLLDQGSSLVDQVVYGSIGGKDQSLTRHPLNKNSDIILHSEIPSAERTLFSPGAGTQENPSDHVATPEINPLLYFSLGIVMLYSKKRMFG